MCAVLTTAAVYILSCPWSVRRRRRRRRRRQAAGGGSESAGTP